MSRHDGSQPTIGTPRSAYGASRSVMSSAIPRARSSRPLEIEDRPQQPPLSTRTDQPAASSSSIAARPIAGSVKVVNESASHTSSRPVDRDRRLSHRSSVSRANRGSGRRRSMPATRSSSRRGARFDSGAVAEPSRFKARIDPNIRERSGTPCTSW